MLAIEIIRDVGRQGLMRGILWQMALNDETKRAKSIAGGYLQYLIETYCACQLRGRWAANGMKQILEVRVGVYIHRIFMAY